MANAHFCSKCGTALPPGSQFCPRCGNPVQLADVAPEVPVIPVPKVEPPQAAPPRPEPRPARPEPRPAATTPPPPAATAPRTTPVTHHVGTGPAAPEPRRRSMWIAVPIALIVLGGIAWLLLSGLPFGGREERSRIDAPQTETIGEGDVGATTTLVEVTETQNDNPPPGTATTTPEELAAGTARAAGTPAPARTSTPARTPTTTPAPAPRQTADDTPRRTVPPVPAPTPAPVRSEPAPEPRREAGGGEMNVSQTIATLRGYITSNNSYDVASDCLSIGSHGYSNRGYTLEVHDTCNGNRSLGRWRVDTLTREVFKQQGDGRYLRP